MIDPIKQGLENYQPLRTAIADLQNRAGNRIAAKASYARAIGLSDNQAEINFLTNKLRYLSSVHLLSSAH